MAGFLDTASDRLALTPQERALLTEAGVRSWNAAHGLLAHGPSLGALPGVRRDELLIALEPLLTAAYRAELSRTAPAPAAGVLPPPARRRRWFTATLGLDLPEVDLAAEPPESKLLQRVAAWPLRDQGVSPTCVAFAVAACLERLRAGSDRPFEAFSPIFLYNRMRARPTPPDPPPAWEQGATKLAHAREVLMQHGICGEASWPDDTPLDATPSPAILEEALVNRMQDVRHCDYPDPVRRPAGVARLLLRRLRAGLPAAIAVPEFVDPNAGDGPSNWWQPHVRLSGVVIDPPPGWRRMAGHAVCVLGFTPEREAPGGGWFIFRNSFRDRWSSQPLLTGDDPPVMPGRGYGAISARYVEKECWEILSPGPSLDGAFR